MRASCCRFFCSWCSRKQARHMKCCSSGIHTLRRRVCQRGQAQGHRSATTLRAGQRPPCAVRHAKRRWHALPACSCVRGRSLCAKLLPRQQRSARARSSRERTSASAGSVACRPTCARSPWRTCGTPAWPAPQAGAGGASAHGACWSVRARRRAGSGCRSAERVPLDGAAQQRCAATCASRVRRHAAADAPRCAAQPATGSCPRCACCLRRRAAPQAPLPQRAVPPWANSCPSRSWEGSALAAPDDDAHHRRAGGTRS